MRTPFDDPREWFRNELRNFLRDAAASQKSWPGRRRRGARVSRTANAFPAVNIYDDGEGFRLRAELPGVDENDLEITAEEDQITIRGERSIEPPSDDANWHRRERQSGEFRRNVTLPEPIDPEGVRANLNLGVLDVFAPRAEQKQPRKIEIE